MKNMNDQAASLSPAPLWRRFAAVFYDSVVVLALWMVVGFVVLWIFGVEGNVNADEEGMPQLSTLYSYTLFICMLLSAWLFFAWFWTHSGQTIGMQAWKIKIQNADNSPISYKQSLQRFFTGLLSLLPAVFISYWLIRSGYTAAGLLALLLLDVAHWWVLFNQERLSLHDRLSESVVVKVPR